MKKNKVLFSLLLVSSLVSCGNTNKKSEVTSSSEEASISSEISSSIESISESSSSSLTSSSIGLGSIISSDQAINLVLSAASKDLNNAKTCHNEINTIGYDGGRKFNQVQVIDETTYLNDLTIANGTVRHYFYDNEDVVYEDTFSQIREIVNYNYIEIKDYKNNVFNDEIQKTNLLASEEEAVNQFAAAQRKVSCGLGYQAMDDLYNTAVANNSELYYKATKSLNGNINLTFEAEAENSSSNQKYIATFNYVFDSLSSGFLLNYTSSQSYYSLSNYNEAEDKNTLTPTYYAKTEGSVNKGILEEHQGDLPVDTSSVFVNKIEVSASKTTIEVDEVIALSYKVYPETALNKDVIYFSTNESVARVDSFGRVTGISEGTCEIQVINVESETIGSIEINVIAKSKPDAGDDSKKGDLLNALTKAKNQILGYTRWIGGTSVDSITGMCIDQEGKLNGEVINTLSISDFYYDENLKKATYVGDYKNIINVIPFYDNGNENLTNNYLLKENSSTIYKDNILKFDIYLAGDNSISYIAFEMRVDYVEFDKNNVSFMELTNENINEKLGTFEAGYKRELYYISEGFKNEVN